MERRLNTHIFVFNKRDNGGEQLCLKTTFFHNGDKTLPGCCFTNQEIELMSYCNAASIKLVGCQITPEILRKLADELEVAREEATNNIISYERFVLGLEEE